MPLTVVKPEHLFFVGKQTEKSWLLIDQDHATNDHQFIHVDPELNLFSTMD